MTLSLTLNQTIFLTSYAFDIFLYLEKTIKLNQLVKTYIYLFSRIDKILVGISVNIPYIFM